MQAYRPRAARAQVAVTFVLDGPRRDASLSYDDVSATVTYNGG
jgi:hypothetical protein